MTLIRRPRRWTKQRENSRKLCVVYVTDVGQSVSHLFSSPPPTWWDLHPEEEYVDALTPLSTFYNDVPADAESCAARLTHQSVAGGQVKLTDAAWRHMPTTYLVCDNDRTIPPSVQERMAEHAVRVHHVVPDWLAFTARGSG